MQSACLRARHIIPCYFFFRGWLGLTLKALITTLADDTLFIYLIFFFFQRKYGLAFHVNWLSCRNSHEMPSLIFSEKYFEKIRMPPGIILPSAPRVYA